MNKELFESMIAHVLEDYGYTYSDTIGGRVSGIAEDLETVSAKEMLKATIWNCYKEGFADGAKYGMNLAGEIIK